MAYARRWWEVSRAKENAKDFRNLSYRKAVLVLIGLHDLLGAFRGNMKDDGKAPGHKNPGSGG